MSKFSHSSYLERLFSRFIHAIPPIQITGGAGSPNPHLLDYPYFELILRNTTFSLSVEDGLRPTIDHVERLLKSK